MIIVMAPDRLAAAGKGGLVRANGGDSRPGGSARPAAVGGTRHDPQQSYDIK
jgi:hypothetical protein